MRLNQVLTPENVLGLRGPERLLQIYDVYTGDIEWIQNGIKRGQNTLHLDQFSMYHFAMAWKYKRERPKTYVIGHDFAETMFQSRGDIPLDILPERFFAYIALPPRTIFDQEGDAVRGAFVFIGTSRETPLDPGLNYQRAIWMSWDYETPEGFPEGFRQYGSILRGFEPGWTSFKEHVNTVTASQPGYEVDDPLVMLFANLVLYVEKGDPDLLPLKTLDHMTNKERKDQHAKHGITNGCDIPVTLVSWGWKKPKTYSVDETTVSGFWRRQRHGPQFSLVKFIWIDEHIRRYKNEPK